MKPIEAHVPDFERMPKQTQQAVAETAKAAYVMTEKARLYDGVKAERDQLLSACQMFMRWMEQDNHDVPEIEELTLQTVSEHIECAVEKATNPPPLKRQEYEDSGK